MTTEKIYALLAIVPLALFYLYHVAKRWRFNKYADLPQLPKSFLFGHLKLVAQLYAKRDSRWHVGMYVQSY